MERKSAFLNVSNKPNDEAFFCNGEVDKCFLRDIKTTFENLFLKKRATQQQLADFLSINKSYVSRVVNGLQIPPHRIRLKIANDFFKVDSSEVWKLKYLSEIKTVIQKQNKKSYLSRIKKEASVSETSSEALSNPKLNKKVEDDK